MISTQLFDISTQPQPIRPKMPSHSPLLDVHLSQAPFHFSTPPPEHISPTPSLQLTHPPLHQGDSFRGSPPPYAQTHSHADNNINTLSSSQSLRPSPTFSHHEYDGMPVFGVTESDQEVTSRNNFFYRASSPSLYCPVPSVPSFTESTVQQLDTMFPGGAGQMPHPSYGLPSTSFNNSNTAPHSLQGFISRSSPSLRSQSQQGQRIHPTMLLPLAPSSQPNSSPLSSLNDHELMKGAYTNPRALFSNEAVDPESITQNCNYFQLSPSSSSPGLFSVYPEFVPKQHLTQTAEKKDDHRTFLSQAVRMGKDTSSDEKTKKKNDERYTIRIEEDGTIKGNRTTLMIKNIPNKYTQKMLLELFDREHRTNYDFFYLPIDFKNNCNVGYAFINMTSVDNIVPLVRQYHDKRWERFNSEKICDIAYARYLISTKKLFFFSSEYKGLLNLLNTSNVQTFSLRMKNFVLLFSSTPISHLSLSVKLLLLSDLVQEKLL
jgi:hypothetical protein